MTNASANQSNFIHTIIASSKIEYVQTQKFFCKHHKNASVQAHQAENKSVFVSKHNQNFSEQKQKESNQIGFSSFQIRTAKKKESSKLAGLKKPLSTTPILFAIITENHISDCISLFIGILASINLSIIQLIHECM